MPEEQQRYQNIALHTSGAIPGIPGIHGPGRFVIDWQERTIEPIGTEEIDANTKNLASPQEGA